MQTTPEAARAIRLRDNRRADSERVLRKFALSSALEFVRPAGSADAAQVVEAARAFMAFLAEDDAE